MDLSIRETEKGSGLALKKVKKGQKGSGLVLKGMNNCRRLALTGLTKEFTYANYTSL